MSFYIALLVGISHKALLCITNCSLARMSLELNGQLFDSFDLVVPLS
jgi:hypothetical protein